MASSFSGLSRLNKSCPVLFSKTHHAGCTALSPFYFVGALPDNTARSDAVSSSGTPRQKGRQRHASINAAGQKQSGKIRFAQTDRDSSDSSINFCPDEACFLAILDALRKRNKRQGQNCRKASKA